ncbi:MAG TPA: bifunctional UDP-N-acetylglucosamine diphosphorylase/glucosamine-1-phosphate N-acetyltransferase GlmU [Terriglobales bacterium]|nr:bifunctional UDP-N-acetylglucosamine diphosphorylase/glucosamine-1-phosphate N-acetyltransferase GlmU [Terriglobales bacterium]
MSSQDFAIAIMAAGKGTRLKSKRPKVLHEVGGKPLLEHVIRSAAEVVPPKNIFVIIGHEAERVRAAVADSGVNFIVQAEQRGTGHAIQTARKELAQFSNFLVLSGDAPLIRPETIRRMRDFHIAQDAAMTILTARPADPTGYGRVLREGSTDRVAAIVEQKSLRPEQSNLGEINSGFYAFHSKPLFANIDRLSTDNPHAEYYLTDMAALLVAEGHKIVAIRAEDPDEVLGGNTIAELVSLDANMRMRKAHSLMSQGVTVFRPETCVIDEDVCVGADTTIEPFVQLLGTTSIGENCRIRSYSVISNSQIASDVNIRPGCIIDESSISSGAIIGPYSHMRPGSHIGEGAHIGNFVETKKLRMGRGSKANHLTYLGDAEIGAGVNVGAGTITCNYDGVSKHQTVIEDGVFVGSDSTLVAPLKIGHGAYIGAASCITDNVPPDSLALGRGMQVVKEGWARRKREERPKKS